MTDRQEKLLLAIIKEFIESAEAVGSVNLVNKYRLDVSSATIRNEMAELMKQGYIQKPHSSAGRVPTLQAYKRFVNSLMEELEDLENYEVAPATLIKQQIYASRFDIDEMIYTALNSLYDMTGNVSMALVGNRVYHTGLARVPTQPEFRQVQELCKLINVLEDRILLKDLFSLQPKDNSVRVLFGDDTDIDVFKKMVIIYSPVSFYNDREGFIGVIGSVRMDYSKALPAVDFIANTINEIVSSW